MNINKLISDVGGGNRSNPTTKTSEPAPSKEDSSKTSGATEVSISQQSKSIQHIEAEVAKLPEIDDAAVERIKGALANNEYKIDYERLAGKMINYNSMLN